MILSAEDREKINQRFEQWRDPDYQFTDLDIRLCLYMQDNEPPAVITYREGEQEHNKRQFLDSLSALRNSNTVTCIVHEQKRGHWTMVTASGLDTNEPTFSYIDSKDNTPAHQPSNDGLLQSLQEAYQAHYHNSNTFTQIPADTALPSRARQPESDGTACGPCVVWNMQLHLADHPEDDIDSFTMPEIRNNYADVCQEKLPNLPEAVPDEILTAYLAEIEEEREAIAPPPPSSKTIFKNAREEARLQLKEALIEAGVKPPISTMTLLDAEAQVADAYLDMHLPHGTHPRDSVPINYLLLNKSGEMQARFTLDPKILETYAKIYGDLLAESAKETNPTTPYVGIGVYGENEQEGLRLQQVYKNCPAEIIGLEPNDLITHVRVRDEDIPLAGLSLEEQLRLVRGKPGQPIMLTAMRDGQEVKLPENYGNAHLHLPRAIDPKNHTKLDPPLQYAKKAALLDWTEERGGRTDAERATDKIVENYYKEEYKNAAKPTAVLKETKQAFNTAHDSLRYDSTPRFEAAETAKKHKDGLNRSR
jgi:hypothetical protein